MSDSHSRPRWIAFSGLFLALAVLLPLGFHAVGMGGRIFLPMHIPVLLAGFIVGPAAGAVVGLLAPGLSHLMTTMPPLYAVPLMTFELAVYGFVAGIAYRRLKLNVYVALVAAMIVGRLMFALGLFVLAAMGMELPYSAALLFSAASPFLAGLPGILLQLVVIPILVAAVARVKR